MGIGKYIRIIEDPYSHHRSRGYSTHNHWSLCNLVFELAEPEPRMEDIVSIEDGSVSRQMSYIISRDDFLRVCPQLEGVRTKTFAIPVEFALPWLPEGRINPRTGKGCGLEEGCRKSRRWKEEAAKLGIMNPFTLKDIRR